MGASPIIPTPDLTRLNLAQTQFGYADMAAQMLVDFQPYMDANEQDEIAMTGIVGDSSGPSGDIASDVGDAANLAGYTVNNGVVQAASGLANAAPGEQAMQNEYNQIDVSGASFVENLQGFIPPPEQFTHVPPGDVLITWEGREGQHWKFWPADKPLPKGTRLVTQAEIDATLNGTGNELANTTQAG